MTDSTENDNRIEKAARDVLAFARDILMVKLRFLDTALAGLELVPVDGGTLATDGVGLFYGPEYVISSYRAEHERPARDYLHVLLHCIFSHMFVKKSVDHDLWDLACDIAAESTINDLDLSVTGSSRKAVQIFEAQRFRSELKMLTAEKVYRYFADNGISESEIERLSELFRADDHSGWYRIRPDADPEGRIPDGSGDDTDPGRDGSLDIDLPVMASQETEEAWKKISEKIQAALETLFREHGDAAGGLMQNLREVNRERYDYAAFLKKFAVLGENMAVNDAEFDYIFYTYGLKLYENMPLVEPLEYKEVRRIREFVIAIDTSGSTSGELVQKFLQKTYNILKSTESYFSRINVHIIQCDAEIQEHVRITSGEEFDSYIRTMSIHGLGGTDFRPVFELVDRLIEEKELEDLKGMIYFTDGAGTYPVRKPGYETAFVFLEDGYEDPDVPPWAIKLVLQNEDVLAEETLL